MIAQHVQDFWKMPGAFSCSPHSLIAMSSIPEPDLILEKEQALSLSKTEHQGMTFLEDSS